MKSIKIIISLFFASLCAFAFADLPEQIVKQQVESIKTELQNGKISDAYEKTNVLLRSFEEPSAFPGNVTAVSMQAYEKYIRQIDESKNYNLIEAVDSNLNIFKGISSSYLQVQVNKVKEKLENQKFQAQSENQLSALKSIKNWLFWIFAVVLLLAVLIFVPFIMISRKSRSQMKNLDRTLKLLAEQQRRNSQILLDTLTDFDSVENLKSAGSSTWGVDALPSPEMTDAEQSELKKLAVECEKLGEEIDKITDRKNNSKNVSELVYKLARKLGLNHNSAKLYFCAAMVYDAGFKALPENLLKSENLSDEQRKLLQTHVEKFESYLGFVPKKFWKVFEEASKYHHENMDGSGYPEGLKGNAIPQVARLIHVAESYNSLISLRNYKQITDKESAVRELESKPKLYDSEVVKMLAVIL